MPAAELFRFHPNRRKRHADTGERAQHEDLGGYARAHPEGLQQARAPVRAHPGLRGGGDGNREKIGYDVELIVKVPNQVLTATACDGTVHKALGEAQDKLEEQLRNDSIMLSIIRERLSPEARLELLKRLRSDRMDPDDISDADARAYAKWYRRVRGLRQRIRELRDLSRWRRERAAAAAVG